MKLVKPNVTFFNYGYTLEEIFHSIADAAKVCYKTEKSKLTDEQFVEMLISKTHLRPLEMGTVYLIVPETTVNDNPFFEMLLENHWTAYSCGYADRNYYITTNFRVVYETYSNYYDVDEDLLSYDFFLWQYLSAPEDHHYQRFAIQFLCSRGCADDFRTHVSLSSVCESSRYCNYSKDKFGNEISFIEPYWKYTNEDIEDFETIERIYMKKIAQGYQPQQAKNYLGLGYATTLRMCGFYKDWENFILKRNSDAAYPECQKLAKRVEKIMYI